MMADIWAVERKLEDDYYWLLGCDELSTTEQINAEFKARVRDVHPDKCPDDPSAVEKFKKLQKARDTLTDEELRKDYDLWRRSGLTVPYEMWTSSRGSLHTTLHWAVRKKKEPMIEDVPDAAQAQGSTDERAASNSFSQYSSFPSGWSREKGNDALQKFRNYEI
ncbi:dnaJ homolog subfamily C member 12-like [Diadema antillarum]|uniref:dnaJ homolog subfamily C member 12-like n=1 Tax=Diadema antillarum TaxID=105358 RepID=UPI003A8AFE1B